MLKEAKAPKVSLNQTSRLINFTFSETPQQPQKLSFKFDHSHSKEPLNKLSILKPDTHVQFSISNIHIPPDCGAMQTNPEGCIISASRDEESKDKRESGAPVAAQSSRRNRRFQQFSTLPTAFGDQIVTRWTPLRSGLYADTRESPKKISR